MAELKVIKKANLFAMQSNQACVITVGLGDSGTTELIFTLYDEGRNIIILPSENLPVALYVHDTSGKGKKCLGYVVDKESGKVAFPLNNGLFKGYGDYQFHIEVISDGNILTFGVMMFRVLDTSSKDYTEAVASTDAFAVCMSDVSKLKDRIGDIISGNTDSAEIIDSRGGAKILRERLDLSDSATFGEDIIENTRETITRGYRETKDGSYISGDYFVSIKLSGRFPKGAYKLNALTSDASQYILKKVYLTRLDTGIDIAAEITTPSFHKDASGVFQIPHFATEIEISVGYQNGGVFPGVSDSSTMFTLHYGKALSSNDYTDAEKNKLARFGSPDDYASVTNAGAIKLLSDTVIIQSKSLESAVDSKALRAGAVTTGKIADGAVTDNKLAQGNIKSIAEDFSNSGIIGFNLEKLEKTIKTEFNSGLAITSVGYSIPFVYDGRNFKYLYIPSVKMAGDGQLTFMLCRPADISGKQIHETEMLSNRKTKIALSEGLHTNVCAELDLDYSKCEVGDEYLICIYGIQNVASPTYSSATKFQLSNIANTANITGVLTETYKDALYIPPNGAWRWTRANTGAEYYITIQCALGVEYPYQSNITSFVNTQIDARKKPLRMENYLPPEIPAVVGDPLELFWDSIFGAKNITNYRLTVQWDNNAWLGEVYDRKLKWTPSNNHIGSHTLKVTAYDDYGQEISAANTVIKVYPIVNPSINKNLLIIGDSLTQYGNDTSTVNTLYYKLQENGITNLNLIGTQSMASNQNARHEGRAGWKAADYLDVTKSPFAIDGMIDFKAYCEKNGYSGIDYCIIHLNWNDTFTDYSGVSSRLRVLAEKVQESYPKCRIMLVGLSSYPKTRMNLWGFCRKTSAWELSKALQSVTDTKENWSTIHLLQERDCEYNNDFVEQPVNLRNDATIKVLKDHVHGGAGEYQQIGDTYYRAIIAQISKDEGNS